ncbi:hypothetical protein [Hominifimenecus sp. rT4P-3]|uniref:hypothetical protein n=1 Tax=Hominifimenecus sp. rT4P-3 TaxID=3242979 RepID=UPI003DA44898
MRNQWGRRAAASFLAVLLGLSTTTSTVLAAEQNAEKVETVYVNANADGSVDQITVSEWLKNTGKGATITDHSTLTKIENVKGDETFESGANGALIWQAGGKDIYYQGETSAPLPVSLKFTYQLDGKEISPEELAGKSGQVKIRIDYTNHTEQTVVVDKKAYTVCTPFCMITGMLLSSDHFTNVEVENGKLISDGKNNIVVGVAFPGLADSLGISQVEALSDVEIPDYVEITADVDDFTLALTATVAATGTLSELGIEENEDFDSLKEDLDKLKDASTQLVEGSGELSDGAQELLEAFGTFTDGLDSASDGAGALKDGIDQMDDKKAALIEGMETLAGGLQTLKSGAETLKTGTDLYTGGVDQLAGGAKQVDAGVEQLYGKLQAMAAGDSELMGGLAALVEGAGNLKGGVSSYTANATKIAEGLGALNSNMGTLVGALANVPSGAGMVAENAGKIADSLGQVLQTINDALGQMKDQLSGAAADLQSSYGTLSAGVQNTAAASVRRELQSLVDSGALDAGQVETIVSHVSGDIGTAMANGGQELSKVLEAIQIPDLEASTFLENAASLKTAAQGLQEGASKITTDPKAFQTTLQTAAGSIQALADGASQLIAYNDGLNQGATAVATGSSSLAQALQGAMPQLFEGVGALKTGTRQLSDGAAELSGKSAELRSGAEQILSGSEQLLSGSEELLTGGKTLGRGIGQLADGAASLVKGMSQLVSGSGRLSDGISSLAEGAKKLADGAKEFDEEGIQKLTDAFDENFQETIDRAKALVDADKAYQSFGGLSDGMKGSVKFIIETAGIEKEE